MFRAHGWRHLLGLLALLALATPVLAQEQSHPVWQITVEGPLTPALVAYVERSLDLAEAEDVEVLILTLNTPGGRLDWMQQIVADLRASPVPVVVYVAPRGASAASAGTLVTLAGHAAAMAPETTIGAASPVDALGGDLDETAERKIKEDVRALARGLTERRGAAATRLAEAMIEDARAVSATEALAAGLIDFIAADREDLLRQLDGFVVEVAGRPVTLSTAGASVRSIEMTWIERVLTRIVDPNLLALLLFIGLQALLIELGSPGGWVAGFIGVVCLALAIYGLGVLPVDWFGLVLIATAFGLFVLDIKAPTHGALTVVGVLTLIAGLLVLFSSPGVAPFGQLSLALVVALGAGTGLFFLFIVAKGLHAQRAPPVTGLETLLGATGVARTDLAPAGFVFVHGERWQAVADQGMIEQGAPVRVVGIEGLRLTVRREPDGA